MKTLHMLGDHEVCAHGAFCLKMLEVNFSTVSKKMAVGLLFQVPVATYQREAPVAPEMESMIRLCPL